MCGHEEDGAGTSFLVELPAYGGMTQPVQFPGAPKEKPVTIESTGDAEAVDLDAMKARHVAYTARLGSDWVPYCTKCGIAWPCDAATLLDLLWRETNQPLGRWRGLCGHEWYVNPKDPPGVVPGCPICKATQRLDGLARAISEIAETARPR